MADSLMNLIMANVVFASVVRLFGGNSFYRCHAFYLICVCTGHAKSHLSFFNVDANKISKLFFFKKYETRKIQLQFI